jgi:AcrR family transcriptional regulator
MFTTVVDQVLPGSNAERILDAASRCFSRYGFQKTAMEDIASEAGMSRRSLYRSFPDKLTLLREVNSRRAGVFLEDIKRSTSAISGLSAQIEEVVRLTNRFVHEDPLTAAMHRADPDALARAVTTGARELLETSMAAIIPLIARARDSGEIRSDIDVRRAAEWMTRVVFSLVATPSVTFDQDDPAQTSAFVREFLLPGLR